MINLYFDDLALGNGRTSDSIPVRYDSTIHKHLEWIDLTYQRKSITEYTETDELNLYVIEMFYVQRTSEVFKNIPEATLELLRNNKLKLLMYFPTEGFKLSLYDNWFIKMHDIFVEYGLANTDKYFIYNNLTIEEQYQTLIDNNQLPCTFTKVFGYPFFQLEHYESLLETNSPQVDTTRMLSKDKDFYCQNAKMRAHRLLLISELDRLQLLENSFTSLLGQHPSYQCEETTIEHVTNVLKGLFNSNNDIPQSTKDHLLNFSSKWKPMILDEPSNKNLETSVLTEYYERSYFSLVTETGMDHHLRITEKTFKPIANYHPFILVGCHGSLSYLKSLGYETFPEFFDESYDNETDVPKRLMMVTAEVEKFCRLSTEEKEKKLTSVIDKLHHNHNMFFNILPEINKEKFRQIFISMK
jgi:hypothetical protein